MHTIKVIAAGLALLVICLLVGRSIGPTPAAGLVKGAQAFLPLWLIGAGINMWIGVSKAGYSVAEEAPIFALIFAVPAVLAAAVWWRFSRG